MDFGDYIYIIIGVLWFLFSIVGGAAKAKKKQSQGPVNEKTTLPGSETDQEVRKMLEDLLQGKKTPKPEVRPVKQTPPQEKLKPSKLDIHKEHADFIQAKKKKIRKSLEINEDSLSSSTESPLPTTSHLQHPPDMLPADQATEIVQQFKDVSSGKHPLMEDFDAQKALIFSEVFNRRFY